MKIYSKERNKKISEKLLKNKEYYK